MKQQPDVVTSLVHEGWAISVRVAGVDDAGAMQGVAEVFRDGGMRYRIAATETFESKARMSAVLVARADRWISAQSGFGPLR